MWMSHDLTTPIFLCTHKFGLVL